MNTPSTTRTVVIFGANGFLGRYLCRHFTRQGREVVAVARKRDRNRRLATPPHGGRSDGRSDRCRAGERPDQLAA